MSSNTLPGYVCIIVLALWAAALMAGCATKPVAPPVPPAPPTFAPQQQAVAKASTDIGTAGQTLQAIAADGQAKTEAVKASIPPDFSAWLTPTWARIKQIGSDMSVMGSTLSFAASALTDKQTQMDAAIKSRDQAIADNAKALKDLQDANAKLEADKHSLITKAMVLLSILGAAGIAGSVALILMGNVKAAIALGGSSLALLGIAQFIVAYSMWITLSGGVLLVAGIVYAAYYAWRNRQAAVQAVSTIEGLKASGDVTKQAVAAVASFTQSAGVSKLIDAIRDNFAPLTKPAAPPPS